MATPSFDMTALTSAELLTLLQKAGARTLTLEALEQHIAAGAPTRPDGKLHFVHYTAWLAGRVK
jgi:hypothetical protein